MPKKVTEIKAFVAMGSRNFRLYFFGQCFALTGTWMQRLAMSWLVLEMTSSGSLMGLVEITNQAPVFILGLFAGMFLDRHDLQRVLIVTQIATIIHSLLIAFLLYTGALNYQSILLLSFLLGVITAIDVPARQASVSQMINHPSQLQSALALQSGSFNLARLIGPAVAGFVIKAGGEIACFILNAVAHLAVLYAYTRMVLPPRKKASLLQRPLDAIREGIRYTFSVPPIRMNILFNYAFSFTGLAYPVLIPLFIKQVLDGDSRHLGFLLGGVGIGAIIGVIYIASKLSTRQLPRHICRMQTGFGLFFAAFSFSPDWRVALAITPVMGLCIVSAMVANNTLIQSLVDENKRGRVLSIYIFGILGFGPIGAFISGHLADTIGPQYCVLGFAVLSVIIGLIHYRCLPVYEATMEPILQEKGL